MSNRKILAGLDASGLGDTVFEVALQLAQQQQASLLLFHCLPFENQDLSAGSYSDIYGQNLVNFSRALQEHLEQELEETRRWLTAYSDRAQQAGIVADWDWKVGEPGKRILECARHWQPDLIVVGRRGRSGLAELLLGSTSNYVFHHAPCSVLVVQGEAPPLSAETKVLVALDRLQQAESVFQQALAIARQNRTRLMFFHCQPIEERLDYFGEVYSEEFVQNSQALHERLASQRAEDQAWLDEYCQRALEQGVTAEWDLKVGGAGFTICEYARTWGANLIVIGRRGRSGLQELLLGSASNYVVHQARCSVLVVQSAGATAPTS